MQKTFSAWYVLVGVGLLAVSCPKPPNNNLNNTNKNGNTEVKPEPPKEADFEKCFGQDWTRMEKLDPTLKNFCNDPANRFEDKIQPCFSYDWYSEKVPAEMKNVCERVGFKDRVNTCKSYNWSLPDDIDSDERAFCKRLGWRDVVDPEICEKQDWTKPDSIKPLLKAQCLKISVIPECNPKKDKACVPAKDVIFSHTQHGVDLPNQKSSITMKFKGNPIQCSDCHSGECSTEKKTKAIKADINRPDHNSCAGNRTGGCHPDFLTNKKMCGACHVDGKASSGNKRLKAYGTDVVVQGQQYGFDFSHKSHIDPNGLVAKDGSKVAKCSDCHSLETSKDKAKDGVKMTQAGHTQCGQCHCDERNQVKMNDCLSCHRQETAQSAESAHAYLDYRPHAQSFKHKSHQVGPDKAAVACETCHVAVAETESIEEIPVPPMLGCLQGCHDGTHLNDPIPAFDGWIQCAECHAPGDIPASVSPKDKKKKK